MQLDPAARLWLDKVAAGTLFPAWPAHLYVEVAHVLVRFVRVGALGVERAGDIYRDLRSIRAHVDLAETMEGGMAVALERGLSVYGAAYAVLAESLDAPLVTADRSLAQAANGAVLLPG